ncbi:tRNA pseudouridine(55) synthase TruB [Granulosicoccus sp. 3-233]|uniref:tRNA pseudouridine(55) synthase TruB n=1 Tax=Granulosicoccus sp. 3-233 TaxID=3417969 RepID=UPI003D34BAB9
MSRRNRKGRAVHGILLLDKPSGGSSNHALQRAKRLFGARKAGHTGSLDPLATGMLPVCFGEATKLSAFLLDADKGYETTMRLGVTTNSADADGEVLEQRPVPDWLTLESFTEICHRFRGPQQQVPPMVSAIKIDGQRLYKLAREGKEVDRPARSVVIHDLQVLSFSGTSARLAVRCSKGTYIRSLVTDIGEAIGCGAHVAQLRRTFVSPFQREAMTSLEVLERMAAPQNESDRGQDTDHLAALDALLLPLDAGLAHLRGVRLDEAGLATFQRGQSAPCRRLEVDPTSDRAAGAMSSSAAATCDVSSGSTEGPSVTGESGEGAATLPCRVYDATGRLAGLGELHETGELVAPRRVLQWD